MSKAGLRWVCWALLGLMAAASPAAAERRRTAHSPQRLSVVETKEPDASRFMAATTPVDATQGAIEIKPAPATASPLLPAAMATAAAPSPAVGSDARQYCNNIANAAADARFAWQARQLAELEGQIKQRIADLEKKQGEYRGWLEKREAAIKAAEKGLVSIYSKMRPEAASQQLSALDDATAAAVLGQLSPRNAGAILNEMETRRAARLANAIAGHPEPADASTKKP